MKAFICYLTMLLACWTNQVWAVTPQRVADLATVNLSKQQAASYAGLINSTAKRYGISDTETIAKLIKVESGFNAAAVGSRASSPNHRTYGLMQIKPAYHHREIAGRSILDPKVNLDVGIKYLSVQLKDCQGNMRCALQRYNQPARWRSKPAVRYSSRILDKRVM
jgi:soluble lytic murein transglycosylase-like protein